MKGYSIDCNFVIRLKEYMVKTDDYEMEEMPIISINTGLWEQW